MPTAPNNLAIRNLAYRYAKAIILRRPAAKYLTPKELTAAARNRVTPSLLALARINLGRNRGLGFHHTDEGKAVQ